MLRAHPTLSAWRRDRLHHGAFSGGLLRSADARRRLRRRCAARCAGSDCTYQPGRETRDFFSTVSRRDREVLSEIRLTRPVCYQRAECWSKSSERKNRRRGLEQWTLSKTYCPSQRKKRHANNRLDL